MAAGLATLWLFRGVVFGGEVLLERDMLRVYLPVHHFWRTQVLRGHLPEWLPHDGLGQPLLGNAVTGPFHPYHLLALPFEPAWALSWVALLCFPLAFGGAWRLLQRLGLGRAPAALGAFVYAFSGYPISLTNNLPYLLALATAPWALAAGRSACTTRSPRALVALALLLALVLLAGDPMAYLITGALVLVLAAALPASSTSRGSAVLMAAAGIALSALLAAVQVTCALAMSRESVAGARTLEEAQLWSVAPDRILDILFGNVWAFRGEAQDPQVGALFRLGADSFWADSLYVGVPALLLAAVGVATARRERLPRLALGMALAGALLMLGLHTPVYGWVYQLVPPWRLLRYPEKLTPHVMLWVAVLAACGMGAVLQWTPARRRGLALSAVVLGLLALGVSTFPGGSLESYLTLLHPGARLTEPTVQHLAEQLRMATLRSSLACLAFGAVLLVPLAEQWRVPLLGVVLGVDLLAASSPMVSSNNPELVTLQPALVSEVLEREHGATLGRARVYSELGTLNVPDTSETREAELSAANSAAMLPVIPTLWDIEGVSGYLQGTSRRVFQLLAPAELRWSRGLALGNVGYAVVAAQRATPALRASGAVVAMHTAFGLALLRNPGVLPRVRLVAPRCVGSADEALARLGSPQFRPRIESAVECGAARLEEAPQVRGTARLLRYAPSEVDVEVQADRPGLLVLADAFYGGWQATVDGEPTPILAADVAFRGVPVPAGAHRVLFRYRTPGLALGAALSLLGLAVCLALWLLPVLTRRRRQAQAHDAAAPPGRGVAVP